MVQRLFKNWVYGSALLSVALLLLSPMVFEVTSLPIGLSFLSLPIYMLHQFEEHDDDRFRLYFNATIGAGHEVLSPRAVFITNIGGVWGVITLSTLGAYYLSANFVFVPLYLMLVNAMAHIAQTLHGRKYNPGLMTAITLFVPLGAVAMAMLNRSGIQSVEGHIGGFAAAVAIHAAILVHVVRKRGEFIHAK